MSSLRARLLVGTTTAVAAVLLVAGYSLYAGVERSLVAELDRELEDQARLLASAVEQEGTHLDMEFDDLDMSAFASAESGSYLELWDVQDRVLLYRSPSLGLEDGLSKTSEPFRLGAYGATWFTPGGQRRRQLFYGFEPRQEYRSSRHPARAIRLTVARRSGPTDEALAALRDQLLVVGCVTLLVLGLVLLVAIRGSLRPLDAVSAQLARMGEDDLSARLDATRVPAELRPVVLRTNELLERLDAAFSRERGFSNDVAHELRTPLAGLRSTLEVAAARPRSEAEYAETLRASAELAAQLQSLVDRLLRLARLEAGNANPNPERFDLADLALEAWEPFAARAEERALSVHWDLGPGLEVTADRALVHLILRNLFENATAYADSSGSVGVRATAEAGVRFEVANSGSALTQAEAAAATQRFWRGDAARTQAGLHCGLGLALVERAVAAVGGALELRSQVGGEFVAAVRLPGERAAQVLAVAAS